MKLNSALLVFVKFVKRDIQFVRQDRSTRVGVANTRRTQHQMGQTCVSRVGDRNASMSRRGIRTYSLLPV